MDGHVGAVFYNFFRPLLMVDGWLLPNAVDPQCDDMPYPLGGDFDAILLAVENEGHAHEGLQRVALRPPG